MLITVHSVQNPYRIAELNLELQIEKIRVVEMTRARDIAVERLGDAYTLIRQKNEFIDLLQRERENKGAKPLTIELSRSRDLEDIERLKSTVAQLHSTINDLRNVMRDMPAPTLVKPVDPPPCYEENAQRIAAEASEVPAGEASSEAEAVATAVLPIEQGGVVSCIVVYYRVITDVTTSTQLLQQTILRSWSTPATLLSPKFRSPTIALMPR